MPGFHVIAKIAAIAIMVEIDQKNYPSDRMEIVPLSNRDRHDRTITIAEDRCKHGFHKIPLISVVIFERSKRLQQLQL